MSAALHVLPRTELSDILSHVNLRASDRKSMNLLVLGKNVQLVPFDFLVLQKVGTNVTLEGLDQQCMCGTENK